VNNLPFIDYDVIDSAIRNYEDNAEYKYIEVPWVVSKKALMVTMPTCIEPNSIPMEEMVASGEQSFMQLILNDKLPSGKYCCATPCYRKFDGLKNDGLHFSQFFKVELINTLEQDFSEFGLADMIYDAMSFMGSIISDRLDFVETEDDPRHECDTFVNYDIVTSKGVELGSYGLRSHPVCGRWVYGTGVALPRLFH
jgi:hypothetical protein